MQIGKLIFTAILLSATFFVNADVVPEVGFAKYTGDTEAVSETDLHVGIALDAKPYIARAFFNGGLGIDLGLADGYGNYTVSAGVGINDIRGDTDVPSTVGNLASSAYDSRKYFWLEVQRKSVFVRFSYGDYVFNFSETPLDKKDRPIGTFTKSLQGTVGLVTLGYKF